jgi:hypothetical protein
MPYKIISPRLGEPGTEYDADGAAANGINVAALVEGGFLEQMTLTGRIPGGDPVHALALGVAWHRNVDHVHGRGVFSSRSINSAGNGPTQRQAQCN